MERLKSGDWAGFGTELDAMRGLLEDMSRDVHRRLFEAGFEPNPFVTMRVSVAELIAESIVARCARFHRLAYSSSIGLVCVE
jgi:hypothetical protein